jgi:hypothetical protein
LRIRIVMAGLVPAIYVFALTHRGSAAHTTEGGVLWIYIDNGRWRA